MLCMYVMYVCYVCMLCMYVMYVCYVCMLCMYVMYICYVCMFPDSPPSPYLFEPIYLFLRFHDIPNFIQPVDQVVEVIYI